MLTLYYFQEKSNFSGKTHAVSISGRNIYLRKKPRSEHFGKKAALQAKTTKYQLQEAALSLVRKKSFVFYSRFFHPPTYR